MVARKSPVKAGEPSPCKATVGAEVRRYQRLVAEAKKKPSAAWMCFVNNAGVFSFAPFEQFSEQEFHRQFNTNVLGMFLMIEAALPAFGAEGGSIIINIGSEASVTAYPTLSDLRGVKEALSMALTNACSQKSSAPEKSALTRSLQPRWNRNGVGAHAAGVMGTEFKKRIIASTSLGRVGQTPRTSRAWPYFFGSDDAGWLTGETIFTRMAATSAKRLQENTGNERLLDVYSAYEDPWVTFFASDRGAFISVADYVIEGGTMPTTSCPRATGVRLGPQAYGCFLVAARAESSAIRKLITHWRYADSLGAPSKS